MCGGFLLDFLNRLLFGVCLPFMMGSFILGRLLPLFWLFIYSLIFLALNRFEIGLHGLLVLNMGSQLHKLFIAQ